MKVAILLSGQPRHFDKETPQNIREHLTSKYDCDIFCHFWWSEEEVKSGINYKTSDCTGYVI